MSFRLSPLFTLGSLILCAGGCRSAFDDSAPTAALDLGYTSEYWFRGVPLQLRGALQGSIALSQQTADGGALSLATWGNMDASDSVGKGLSPPGNGGKLTEIDLTVDYTRQFGALQLSGGVISYEFPNLVGVSTAEAYLGLGWSAIGLDQGLTVYYDFAELDDLYASFALGRGFELGNDLTLDLGAQLGFMGSGQAEFYFGDETSGFSDLLLSATLAYPLDEITTLSAGVHGVSVLDSELSDALEGSGLETDSVWVTVGASWGL